MELFDAGCDHEESASVGAGTDSEETVQEEGSSLGKVGEDDGEEQD